jgi:hypothetical protein
MTRFASLIFAAASLFLIFEQARAEPGSDAIARGRYLIATSGCNDCHTPFYAERGGNVPETEWLVGMPVGFFGPWGTSYPANLRLVAARMSEEQFIARARSQLLPPMPWFSLAAMTDDDVRAMYQFILSLGPAGEDMPAYVPPGQKITTPYIEFVPRIDE